MKKLIGTNGLLVAHLREVSNRLEALESYLTFIGTPTTGVIDNYGARIQQLETSRDLFKDDLLAKIKLSENSLEEWKKNWTNSHHNQKAEEKKALITELDQRYAAKKDHTAHLLAHI